MLDFYAIAVLNYFLPPRKLDPIETKVRNWILHLDADICYIVKVAAKTGGKAIRQFAP